jgi:plastin-1
LSTKAGESGPAVLEKLAQLSIQNTKGVSFEGFLTAISKVRQEKGIQHGQTKDAKKIVLHGHMENTTHTINEDEKESFVTHINQTLGKDKHLQERFPIDPKSMKIFTECQGNLRFIFRWSVTRKVDKRCSSQHYR